VMNSICKRSCSSTQKSSTFQTRCIPKCSLGVYPSVACGSLLLAPINILLVKQFQLVYYFTSTPSVACGSLLLATSNILLVKPFQLVYKLDGGQGEVV
jgi:hypothetical protein